MRNCKNFHASIDIGTQRVVVLVGQKLSNGIQITAESSVEIAKDIMARGEIQSVEIKTAISSALNQIRSNYNLEIKGAYVSFSGCNVECNTQTGYVFIKNADNAVVKGDIDELDNSMKSVAIKPGQKIISTFPREYILDGNVQNNPLGMIGSKLEGEYNVVSGDIGYINRVTKCLNDCGVTEIEFVLSSIASSRAVLLEGEAELGVMVVDIGAGATDVAIFTDNVLRYVGVVPIGGNIINRDIRSIGLLDRHVENLKIVHGNAFSADVDSDIVVSIPAVGKVGFNEVSLITLSNIIQARCNDIIAHILHILSTTELKSRLGKIVLTGGTSNLASIDKLFEMYFNCDVRIAYATDNIDEEASVENISNPRFSTAIGLVMESIDKEWSGRVVDVDTQNVGQEEVVEHATFEGEQGNLFEEDYEEEEEVEEESPKVKEKQKNGFFTKVGNIITTAMSDSPEQDKK